MMVLKVLQNLKEEYTNEQTITRSSFIVALFRKNEDTYKVAKKNKNIIEEYKCYTTNYVLNEVITIVSMRTKDIELTKKAYYFMIDNFTIINEQDTPNFNTHVMNLFEKFNKKTFHLSFIYCSLILFYKQYNIDYIVSFDGWFKKVKEIKTYEFIE